MLTDTSDLDLFKLDGSMDGLDMTNLDDNYYTFSWEL
jgi:hypothetical protein